MNPNPFEQEQARHDERWRLIYKALGRSIDLTVMLFFLGLLAFIAIAVCTPPRPEPMIFPTITSTPTVTNTPWPTASPTPTVTVRIVADIDHRATATPAPTRTPMPTWTATTVPTETPARPLELPRAGGG